MRPFEERVNEDAEMDGWKGGQEVGASRHGFVYVTGDICLLKVSMQTDALFAETEKKT